MSALPDSKHDVVEEGRPAQASGDRLPKPPALHPELPPPDRPVSERSAGYRRFGLAYTIPTALIAPVVVLTLLGAWLDQRMGDASSGYTIGGAVLGLVVGTVNMLRLAARLDD